MKQPKWSLWAVVGAAIVCMTPSFPSLLSGGTDQGFHGNETSVQNQGPPLHQPISTPASMHTSMSCSWGQPANASPQLVPSICIFRTVFVCTEIVRDTRAHIRFGHLDRERKREHIVLRCGGVGFRSRCLPIHPSRGPSHGSQWNDLQLHPQRDERRSLMPERASIFCLG